MIDRVTALAFAVSQGSHALLLGSGVSRAAGIPTGWDVMQDLLRRAAAASSEQPDDAASWYLRAHGTEPTYGGVLEDLAATPAERAQILRGYFEPNEDERDEGKKQPTAAHHAIAQLAAAGKIRVIVTPNFDRLPERALQEAGMEPVVVTPTNAAGAPPLTQTRLMVIKPNGDYLDLLTLNTAAELATYGEPMSDLLAQVVDEFGLVVCGWSGDYDVALRQLIREAPARRYTMYWAHRSDPSAVAAQLIADRRAVTIPIESAEAFFPDLLARVEAVSDLGSRDAISAEVAIADVKRRIVDPAGRIRLRDLVSRETERVIEDTGEEPFPLGGPAELHPELRQRLARYEARTSVLQAVLGTGCYYGELDHLQIWQEAIERVGNARQERTGLYPWIDLLRYPAMLLLYAGGVGAVAAGKWPVLAGLLRGPMLRRVGDHERRAGIALSSYAVLDHRHQALLEPNRAFPLSDHLHEVLREPLRDVVPDDARYTAAFDRYEYLAGIWVGSTGEAGTGSPGAFAYRRAGYGGKRVFQVIREEADAARGGWPPLALFDGGYDAFVSGHEGMERAISSIDIRLRP